MKCTYRNTPLDFSYTYFRGLLFYLENLVIKDTVSSYGPLINPHEISHTQPKGNAHA